MKEKWLDSQLSHLNPKLFSDRHISKLLHSHRFKWGCIKKEKVLETDPPQFKCWLQCSAACKFCRHLWVTFLLSESLLYLYCKPVMPALKHWVKTESKLMGLKLLPTVGWRCGSACHFRKKHRLADFNIGCPTGHPERELVTIPPSCLVEDGLSGLSSSWEVSGEAVCLTVPP